MLSNQRLLASLKRPQRPPSDRSKAFSAAMCSAGLDPAWSFDAIGQREQHRQPMSMSVNEAMNCTVHRERALPLHPRSLMDSEQNEASRQLGGGGTSTALAPGSWTKLSNVGCSLGKRTADQLDEVQEGSHGAEFDGDKPDFCEETASSPSVCGVLGCTQRQGHAGLCEVKVDRASRARRLPRWRELQIEDEGKSADEDLDDSSSKGGGAAAQQNFPKRVACSNSSVIEWKESSWGMLYPCSTVGTRVCAPCGSSDEPSSHTAANGDCWTPPVRGSAVLMQRKTKSNKLEWAVVTVINHFAVRADGAFLVVRNGEMACLFKQDEGVTWRRVPVRKGQAIEVEVAEEGQIVWRRAIVRNRQYVEKKRDGFIAVVCYADGSRDEEFVESFSLCSEGIEWRRLPPE